MLSPTQKPRLSHIERYNVGVTIYNDVSIYTTNGEESSFVHESIVVRNRTAQMQEIDGCIENRSTGKKCNFHWHRRLGHWFSCLRYGGGRHGSVIAFCGCFGTDSAIVTWHCVDETDLVINVRRRNGKNEILIHILERKIAPSVSPSNVVNSAFYWLLDR